MISVYVTLGILLLVEYYSLGVVFLAKGYGIEKPYKNFIPYYAFKTARKISGPFSILTIPVKKFSSLMISMSVVVVLAVVYASWGGTNLPEPSASSLWQIMTLVIVICGAIFYSGIVCIMPKICRRFYVRREKLYVFLSLLILPVPFLYYHASKNEHRTDAQMY